MDAVGSNIRGYYNWSKKNTSRLNNEINEEWISDRQDTLVMVF